MKIAMIIAGRVTRYEVCLLPMLLQCPYNIDIFMSINGTDCEYYDIMKQKLSKCLKSIVITPYNIPENLPFNIEHNNSLHYQHHIINGKQISYNQLSMFYNSMKAFELACDYESLHNIKYDIFMKCRPDICANGFPQISLQPELTLLCAAPYCDMIGLANYHVRCANIDWAWSNKDVMKVYFNTYNYILNELYTKNGCYLVHCESALTDMLCSSNIPYKFVNFPFKLDRHRRMFDTPHKTGSIPIPHSHSFVDIKLFRQFDIPIDPV